MGSRHLYLLPDLIHGTGFCNLMRIGVKMASLTKDKNRVIDYIAKELDVDREIIAQNFGKIEHIIVDRVITIEEINEIGKHISETINKAG